MTVEIVLKEAGYSEGQVNGIYCEKCHGDSRLVGDAAIGFAFVCDECKIYELLRGNVQW